MNHAEKIKEQWRRGELSIGTAVSLTDAAVRELLGEAGYDFVWIDCEHSAMTPPDALNHVRAARGAMTRKVSNIGWRSDSRGSPWTAIGLPSTGTRSAWPTR